MKTRVINCRRRRRNGWDVDFVYVGRPSRWGNPFVEGRDGNREEVIRKFREMMENDPRMVEEIKRDLQGKILGCWCRPSEGFRGRLLCHGQILAGIADGISPEEVG